MKKVMMSFVLVGVVGLSADCAFVATEHLKYSNRVLAAIDLGVKPSSLDVRLAIDFGVKAVADCEGKLPPKAIANLKSSIKALGGF